MKLFLDEEDNKFVKESIKELSNKKKIEEGDFVEWGSIGVKISDILDKEIIFEVYRILSIKEVKKQKKK